MNSAPYPCLWFDDQAKAAAEFYCSVFPNSKILNITPMVAVFELNGTRFMGLNGGPEYSINEGVSFVINCNTQEEIDHYWNRFAEGGLESKCGWIKDKFGVWWQVVPSILGKLMSDPEKAPKAMYAYMQMKKFDIEKLIEATA
jgi:predicted 3-demethylubiquinone-9 3-methyltransferase (glyoxalase superfamily)